MTVIDFKIILAACC